MDAQINVEVYPIGPYNGLNSLLAGSRLVSEETPDDDDATLAADAGHMVGISDDSARCSRRTSGTKSGSRHR